jgi:hypothetical protein
LYGVLQRQSAMMAFADAFWMLAVVYLVIAPLVFLMKRTAPGAPPASMH